MDLRLHYLAQSGKVLVLLAFSSILVSAHPIHVFSVSEHEDFLFSSNEPIEITLLGNFQKLLDDRGEDRSNHRGTMYYLTDSQDTIYRKVKLKTRGNFRRDPANCKYPPIRVKFGSEEDEDLLFSGQSKLKLVIQCQIEKYVLLEYLAYRIYNEITVKSYKVRLAHITYVDSKTGEKYTTKYGFFIESQDKLEDRLEAEDYDKNILQYFVDRKEVITMALFQYLIGNDDWYVLSKHNMTILQERDTGDLMVIPYDFDWSKLVGADYTKPANAVDSDLKERRVYKGLCMTEEEFDEQRLIFNEKKDNILGLVNEIPNLTSRERKKATREIEQFYSILNRSKSLSDIFSNEPCVVEQEIGGFKKSLNK